LLLGLPLYNRAGTAVKWLVPLGALCLLMLAALAVFIALPHPPPRPPGTNRPHTPVTRAPPPKGRTQQPAAPEKKPEETEEKKEEAATDKKAEETRERKAEAVPDKKDEQPVEKKAEPVEQKKGDMPPESPVGDRKEVGKYVTQAMAP